MDWIFPFATKAAQIITAVIFGWIAVYGIIWLIFAVVKIFRKGIVLSAKESLGTGHQTLEEFNRNFIERIKNRKKRFFRGLFLFCVWLFTWVPPAIVLNMPSAARVIPGNWKTVIRIYIISVWLVSFGYLLYTDWKKRQG